MESIVKKIVDLAKSKHSKSISKHIAYGTAGLRGKAIDLDFAVYRLGVLAALRAKHLKATIGAVVTASHNPEPDNGVKLVDPMGEMMESVWEKYANQLIECSDDDLASGLQQLCSAISLDVNYIGNVVVARDTRPSSPELSQALIDGIEAVGATYHNYGLLTTPQLHYMVRCINTNESYGVATEQGYNDKFTSAFVSLIKQAASAAKTQYVAKLMLDGANGVGAPKVSALKSVIGAQLDITVCNEAQGTLNEQCGADYVKSNQRAPAGITLQPGMRCAALDGDADRVVYFFGDHDGAFRLLDGDRIAILIAGYLKTLLDESKLPLQLGLVQTAYANGSSTNYITQTLKMPVACTPTGVKHLHHKAQDFDIGVYFEANGHGTVLFSEKAQDLIKNISNREALDADQLKAVERLQLVIALINQAVGDAISDFLLVEVILHALDWSASDWYKCYTDLPNRMRKVVVADRTVITTTDAERVAVTPHGLQDAINNLVSKYKHGRSFVRPSGTEDIVRVYAEADTQENCDRLAHEVCCLVYELAGGVGAKPEI